MCRYIHNAHTYIHTYRAIAVRQVLLDLPAREDGTEGTVCRDLSVCRCGSLAIINHSWHDRHDRHDMAHGHQFALVTWCCCQAFVHACMCTYAKMNAVLGSLCWRSELRVHVYVCMVDLSVRVPAIM